MHVCAHACAQQSVLCVCVCACVCVCVCVDMCARADECRRTAGTLFQFAARASWHRDVTVVPALVSIEHGASRRLSLSIDSCRLSEPGRPSLMVARRHRPADPDAWWLAWAGRNADGPNSLMAALRHLVQRCRPAPPDSRSASPGPSTAPACNIHITFAPGEQQRVREGRATGDVTSHRGSTSLTRGPSC